MDQECFREVRGTMEKTTDLAATCIAFPHEIIHYLTARALSVPVTLQRESVELSCEHAPISRPRLFAVVIAPVFVLSIAFSLLYLSSRNILWVVLLIAHTCMSYSDMLNALAIALNRIAYYEDGKRVERLSSWPPDIP